MSESNNLWAIVPAAGVGSRMGGDIPKQYLQLFGRTLLAHTCRALLSNPRVTRLLLVVAEGDDRWPGAIAHLDTRRILSVAGGEERCHSVFNGLVALRENAAPDDWVLVHDAARPCLQQSDMGALLSAIEGDPVGGLLGIPVRDTMKRTDQSARVIETVDRSSLWHALTPQVFRYHVLFDALESVLDAGVLVTDEASAVERLGHQPLMVPGSASNLKVTRPEDLNLAEWYLKQQESQQ